MKPPVTRKALLKATLDPEKTIATVDIQEVTMGPEQKAPLHRHPCPTLGVVTEGSIAFQIEGQPVQQLKTGDAFYEPANVGVARFDNDGDTPASVRRALSVEQGRARDRADFRQMMILTSDKSPNKITGANAGGRRHLTIRAPWAARIAQF